MNKFLCTIIVIAFLLGNMGKVLSGETITLTDRDSGKTVGINVGDELEIVLRGNPTTGYLWETDLLDSNILSHSKSDFLPDTKAMGSGGIEINQFKAIAEGTSHLKLIFHRPFERNILPLKMFDVVVIIKN